MGSIGLTFTISIIEAAAPLPNFPLAVSVAEAQYLLVILTIIFTCGLTMGDTGVEIRGTNVA